MFDLYFFNLINGLAGKYAWLDSLGIFFAAYFEYVFFALIILLLWKSDCRLFDKFSIHKVLSDLFSKFNKKLFVEILLSGILSRGIIIEIIRFFWYRPRPYVVLGIEKLGEINLLLPFKVEASFPSGHTILFFALATTIYFYNKKIGIYLLAGSALMGLARIFVGYHWPSDILVGAILGVLVGFILNYLIKNYAHKIIKNYNN